MQFTYRAYENLINLLQHNKYIFCSYHNYFQHDNCVILRHDVDYSLEKALSMAHIERELGIKSTYFVLLSTDFYNIASKKCQSIIGKIYELGHEIGLHFDEAKYDTLDDEKKFIMQIKNEAEVMGMLLGFKINCVSMHRPSKVTLVADYQIQGIINSYSKVFFNEFKYVSDSRRNWREDIESIMSSGKYKRLHILIHPFWYNNEEKTLEQSISEYVNSANENRYITMEDNIRSLNEIMKISEVLK